MNDIDKTIKHFEGLQKRYQKQHNGKMCERVEDALEVLKAYALKQSLMQRKEVPFETSMGDSPVIDFYNTPTPVNRYHSFEIYQLPLSNKRFMVDTDWEKASKEFEPFNYCCTYVGRFLEEKYIQKLIEKNNGMASDSDLLEAVFYMTAMDELKNFGGHPIKSSFVVILNRGDNDENTKKNARVYYCNPVGWTDISKTWWQDRTLALMNAASAERALTQN